MRIIVERELWPGTRLLLALERLLDPSDEMIDAMKTVEAPYGRPATPFNYYRAAVRQLLDEHRSDCERRLGRGSTRGKDCAVIGGSVSLPSVK